MCLLSCLYFFACLLSFVLLNDFFFIIIFSMASQAMDTTGANRNSSSVEMANQGENASSAWASAFYPDGISPANGQGHMFAEMARKMAQN